VAQSPRPAACRCAIGDQQKAGAQTLRLEATAQLAWAKKNAKMVAANARDRAGRFAEPFLTLSETGYQELLATVTARQILGGPAYDALIALTAAEHQATLLSLDHRAVATYQAIGVTVEQLVSWATRRQNGLSRCPLTGHHADVTGGQA
jgi:predicted nucleic acid-binding protein